MSQSAKQPFGPVFAYDLVRTTRKGQLFAHRFLYLSAVLAGILLVFSIWAPGDLLTALLGSVRFSHQEAAHFAWSMFSSFLFIQFAGVLIITPAYTAGAVALERERRTLEFLLVTDLTDREIVLGLLAARLANLLLLILAGMPVFCLLQFVGGVEPAFILAAFAATLLLTLSVGSLSILVSVYTRRPLPAVMATYVWLAVGLASTACIPGVNFSNPFIFIVALGQEETSHLTVPLLMLAYAVCHGIVTFICCKWAVFGLRDSMRDPQWYTPPSAPRVPELAVPKAEPKLRERLGAGITGWGPYPAADQPAALEIVTTDGWGPEWDGAAARPRRRLPADSEFDFWPRVPVGDDALLWKETRGNFNWLRCLYQLCTPGAAVPLGVAFAVVLLIHICVPLAYGDQMSRGVNPPVRVLSVTAFGIALFIMTVNASVRISREREQQTLDSLRTAPLNGVDILLPKWVASVWSARPLGFFIGLVWAFGFVTGGLHAAALPLLLAAALIYAAFFATLGLWMSMAYHSTMRATLFAVLAAAVLIPGPGLFGKIFFDPPALSGPPPVWDERLVSQMLSPALTMWTLTFDAGNLFGKDVGLPMLDLAAAVIGLHFYLLVTMILWASLLARFEAEKGPAANNAECKMQHAE